MRMHLPKEILVETPIVLLKLENFEENFSSWHDPTFLCEKGE